jgi:hypothetical protein
MKLLIAVLLAVSAYAQTSVPANAWTELPATGYTLSRVVGWDPVRYVPGKGTCGLLIYRSVSGEPNRDFICYDFANNRINVVDRTSSWHNAHTPEGGHPVASAVDIRTSIMYGFGNFSGDQVSENYRNTWSYDFNGRVGRDLQPPTGLHYTIMQPAGAFDPVNGVYVVHGGTSSASIGTNEYTVTTNAWDLATACTSPSGSCPDPGMTLASMEWNPTDGKLYLFGGYDAFGAAALSNDIYTYTVATDTWAKLTVSGTPPSARWKAGWVYMRSSNKFLMYGGSISSSHDDVAPGGAANIKNDTWIFDPVALSWTQITPSSNPASQDHAAFDRVAYDWENDVVVFFGSESAALTIYGFRYGDGFTGNMPTSTSLVSPSSLPSVPAQFAFHSDTTFDNVMYRISDAAGLGYEVSVPEYAQRQAWNSDGSKIMLVVDDGKDIYDAKTFRRLLHIPVSMEAPRWSPADPNIIYYTDGTDFKSYNLATTTATVLHDFSVAYPDGFNYGEHNEEMGLNASGQVVTMLIGKPDNGDTSTWEIITYNVTTDTIGGTMDYIQTGVSSCGTGGPQWVRATNSYFIIQWGGGSSDHTNRFCGLEVFNFALTFQGRASIGGSHGDLYIDSNGDEYYVSFASGNGGTGIDQYGIQWGKLPNGYNLWLQGTTTQYGQLTDMGTTYAAGSGHISCQAPGVDFCIVSTYADDATKSGNGINTEYEDEIWAIYMDSTTSSEHVVRMAHHRSEWYYADQNCSGNPSSYWVAPHATISRDGRHILFGSSWGDNCISNAYLLDITATLDAGTLSTSYSVTSGNLNRNTDSWADRPSVAVTGSTIYAGWVESGAKADTSDAFLHHPFSSSWLAGSRTNLGADFEAMADEGAGMSSDDISCAFVDGTFWCAWQTEDYSSWGRDKIVWKSWNGSAWSGVAPIGMRTAAASCGGGCPSSYSQGQAQIVDVNDVPHMILKERAVEDVTPYRVYAYVVKNVGGTISTVGGALNRDGDGTHFSQAESVSITSDGTHPCAAFTEYERIATSTGVDTSVPQVYVSCWDGASWDAIGGAANVSTSNRAFSVSITWLGGQPYVAFTERSDTGVAKLYVRTYSGGVWSTVGGAALNTDSTTGWAFEPSLTTDGTDLFLGWVEQAELGDPAQTYVKKWNGSSWSSLGTTLNADATNGSAQGISIAMSGANPVAFWGETKYGTLRQIYAQEWNGSSWEDLGAAPSGNGGSRITGTVRILGTARIQ